MNRIFLDPRRPHKKSIFIGFHGLSGIFKGWGRPYFLESCISPDCVSPSSILPGWISTSGLLI